MSEIQNDLPNEESLNVAPERRSRVPLLVVLLAAAAFVGGRLLNGMRPAADPTVFSSSAQVDPARVRPLRFRSSPHPNCQMPHPLQQACSRGSKTTASLCRTIAVTSR